jgi:chemotaxis protein MotA
VLGLIQVMKNLSNIDAVGHGIAVAFVATVYGVGSANIFFLPAGNKLKARAREQALIRELALEGVSAIVEGLNPKLIRFKLEAYAKNDSGKQARSTAGARSSTAAAFGGER